MKTKIIQFSLMLILSAAISIAQVSNDKVSVANSSVSSAVNQTVKPNDIYSAVAETPKTAQPLFKLDGMETIIYIASLVIIIAFIMLTRVIIILANVLKSR